MITFLIIAIAVVVILIGYMLYKTNVVDPVNKEHEHCSDVIRKFETYTKKNI